mmetsp:Transcript_63208/g.137464  ORF Transcript_63208/g.137464 Transcript_63208/m.137464 type:complete len:460 (+) Transcript_63208:94-1473(+)
MESLPLVRCPCNKRASASPKPSASTDSSLKALFLEEILGFNTYEMPRTVKVKSTKVGILKVVLMSLVFIGYFLGYGLFWNKSYLEISAITGIMRMNMQHPTAHCNPLHEDCLDRFKPLDELPYCQRHSSDGTVVQSQMTQQPCEYLDEYDVGNVAFQGSVTMMPTRLKRVKQEKICDSARTPCPRQYKAVAVEDVFVADMESFTVLIDHSVTDEEVGVSHSAWELDGFLRPCPPPHDCPLMPIQSDSQRSPRSPLDPKVSQQVNKLWNAGEPANMTDAFALPNGDVFRMGFLLDFLGVEMDSDKILYDNRTLRQEGVSLMMTIVYSNFAPGSMPNSLPPMYEYQFSVAPYVSYKRTQTFHVPGEPTRLMNDQHGVFINGRQKGHLGVFNFRNCFLMLLEAGLLFSAVRWIISLVLLNWPNGNISDNLETKMTETLEFNSNDTTGPERSPEGRGLLNPVE